MLSLFVLYSDISHSLPKLILPVFHIYFQQSEKLGVCLKLWLLVDAKRMIVYGLN